MSKARKIRRMGPVKWQILRQMGGEGQRRCDQFEPEGGGYRWTCSLRMGHLGMHVGLAGDYEECRVWKDGDVAAVAHPHPEDGWGYERLWDDEDEDPVGEDYGDE